MTRIWTSAQRTAIESRARTLVAAAAGSGKTSVLTELVVEALVAREVAPAEVCAVTFTEKSAQEMRGRIAARLAELDERDLLAELELARIGTIHSLCATILRRHGTAVGVDPAVGQLDEAQDAWILRTAHAHALELLEADPDVYWLRARTGDERIEETLRGIHRCAAQSNGLATLATGASAILDPKTGEALVSAPDAERAQRAFSTLWGTFSSQVEARKHALGRISFDDLERLAVEAVRIPAVRADLRARWTMVLVDEFQDTNARQYELLDAIGGERLFMVGDEWQSIYRFRGADVDVFRARRADPAGGTIVPMRENFRSAAPVLDVVNRVFAHERLFGERYEPVLPGTDAQRDARGPRVELLVVPTDEPDDVTATSSVEVDGRALEARRVAERVAELIDSGEATPGDIALLYAKGTGVGHYERALGAWGIPVLRAASGGYYDQRDVRDVLELLALVRNHADDHAALSVLAGPIGGLSWSELADLVATARAQGRTLAGVARESVSAGARQVIDVIDMLDQIASRASLVQLVARVVELPQLQIAAALAPDGVVRVANLRRLIELAASAEQVGVRDVAGFLEFVTAQRRDARVGEASIADENVGAVRLLTVHAAKGLEFEHVFVIEAGSGSSGRPGLVPAPMPDEHGIVHVALPRPDGRPTRTPALDHLHERDGDAAREESLRLWYVAMTRARSHLYVSGRWRFEPTKAGSPRAVSGALAWLREALDLDASFGGPSQRSTVLDGLVQVDTFPASTAPRDLTRAERVHVRLASPLELPTSIDGAAGAMLLVAEPHALRAALRDAVSSASSDEWRQLDGTRVHDAVARVLDAATGGVPRAALLDPERGPWLTDSVRGRLEPVVAAPVFERLVALSARTEVAYVAGSGATVTSRAAPGVEVAATAADVDSGRIDALAVLASGDWWVVDWKSTLPSTSEAAWSDHGAQLERYARAAAAAGAPATIVTLVPLDDPDTPYSWRIDADGTRTEAALP